MKNCAETTKAIADGKRVVRAVSYTGRPILINIVSKIDSQPGTADTGPDNPAAAAAKTKCPRLPTELLPMLQKHRVRHPACPVALHNPFTDTCYEVYNFKPECVKQKNDNTGHGPGARHSPVAVARSVSKAEMKLTPKALAAMSAEWERLRALRTWIE